MYNEKREFWLKQEKEKFDEKRMESEYLNNEYTRRDFKLDEKL